MSWTNIIKKKRGAGTVPRGTPDRTFEGSDYFPLTTTLWLREGVGGDNNI